MTIAIYAGSFDPVTKGHEDLMFRASRQFEKIIVGVGVNSGKTSPLFTHGERIELIHECIEVARAEFNKHWHLTVPDEANLDASKIEVKEFSGLLVDFCRDNNATVILKGLRTPADFQSELGMAQANNGMDRRIDTFFMPTRTKFLNVSSSLVREIASFSSPTGWDSLNQYVSEPVIRALRKKFKKD